MIVLQHVSKIFGTGAAGLSDITLSIEKGEFVFLVGHTGSGKTTMLRLLIREFLPTEGTITIGDIDLVKLPEKKIPHLRKRIGVIFQDLKLLMDRTIFENVLLPLEIVGIKPADAEKRAEELLTQVGMIEHKFKFPIQLSGGELQRVAIARALTLAPDVILADEPTGNLDSKTAFEIVELINTINKNHGTTIVMATHNLELLGKYPSHTVVRLNTGKIESIQKQNSSKQNTKGVQTIENKDSSEKNPQPVKSIFVKKDDHKENTEEKPKEKKEEKTTHHDKKEEKK